MTREEQRALQRQKERAQRERDREAWEAARGPLDLPCLLLALVLMTIGLIMVLSASFPSAASSKDPCNYDPLYYFKRQAIFAAIGLVAMFWMSKINYQRLRGVGKYVLIVAVVLLVLVILPGPNKYGKLFGVKVNGATRWLKMFLVTGPTYQPSEVAKLGIILYFAATIAKKREKMQTFREGILPYGLILVVVALLMWKEPHLSGLILLLGIGAAMMLVGGSNWKWITAGVSAAGLGLYLMLFTDLMEKIGYNSDRIKTWHDPFWDPRDKSYQTSQSLIAIGSGGLWGTGLGKSRQKFMFLPEEHNDCIFAITCEELGLVGATLIMVLFALLVIRGYWLAIHARDRFGSLLIVGVTTQIALQTFLNIAVVSNFIPNTGISLPFFSYGGTALAIQLLEVGIVLSVSRQIPAPKSK